MTLASPCVGTCRLDDATGLCLGCARTGVEIAEWKDMSAASRGAVWEVLPERFERLGISGRRVGWTTEELRDFVRATLEDGGGTWTMGVIGGVAEFTALPGEAPQVERDGDDLIARVGAARLRMRIDDDVRALTFEPAGTPLEASRIVLAVKRSRPAPPVAQAVAALGPDADALDPSDRGARLYDLGLGRKDARFCLRVEAGAAETALRAAEGRAFGPALSRIGAAVLAESPPRVVETALGRIEVLAHIPPPGGQSPLGAHTHLMPDHLATGRTLPAGMDLPRAYRPGAMFYPPRV
ncbi:MAG: DUF1289 domain-containing protein [Pseudomonadota bacterium]